MLEIKLYIEFKIIIKKLTTGPITMPFITAIFTGAAFSVIAGSSVAQGLYGFVHSEQ